jgi:uroporphyrinogen decarboxylase
MIGEHDPFLATCRGEDSRRVPVWFMRQAGRALPEYRAARGEGSILDAIKKPELAAELTIQPVRRYGVDAAVLFSDIVVPVAAMGFGVEIKQGVGPVVEHPFAGPEDLARLRHFEAEADLSYVIETIRILKSELKVPLIGFAGAPFTVASYLVEGGPSRDHVKTKTLMYNEPDLWSQLLDRLAEVALATLKAQIAAGVDAVQLFDSWAGALSPDDYEKYVFPASHRVLSGLADSGVPRIHFGVGTGELLGSMARAGADVVGVDWRVPLDQARTRIADGLTVQGNLDPVVILAGWEATRVQAERVLAAGGGSRHIFNLGHGVLPSSDPGVLTELVGFCHDWTPSA